MTRRAGLLLFILAISIFWSVPGAQPQTPPPADQQVARIDSLGSGTSLAQYVYITDLPAEMLSAWLDSPGTELQRLINQFPGPLTAREQADNPSSALHWRRNTSDKVELDAASRLSWLVIDILYTGAVETTALLDLSGADGIAWSYQGPLGNPLSFADDFDLPLGGRPVFDTSAVIPVLLTPNQRTRLHINVMTISDEKFMSFDVLSPDQFRAQRLHRTVLDGAYYGVVLALILYNLFLYFALRRNTHLYFCLFAGASAGLIYLSSALSLVFGLQNPFALSLPMIYLAHGLVYIVGALYSMHLLGIDTKHKPLFHLWTLLIAINLLVTAWLVYSARHGGYSTDNISPTFDVIIVLWGINQLVYLTTVLRYWQQSVLARLWFVGISIHISIMGVWPLILDSELYTEFAPYQLAQVTTLFNVILLSALSAHQFRTEQAARVKAQQTAVENLRIAHDLERAKSNFVANVGHDLRGPIQAISHFTEAMKLTLPNRINDTLEKIDGNLERISGLIDSMTQLSRVEWQGTHPDLAPVALADILGELKTEFSARAAARNLRLQMQDTSHRVLSDRVCLGQICRNLIENAIKYTDAGEVRINVSDDPNFVSVVIWDTGRGIPEEHLPHIFEEFYQTGPADSSGVGLGLAIVERLCRLLDIQISVASTPGYGTRFTLKLKKYQPQSAVLTIPELPSTAPMRSLNNLKVLAISQDDCLTELNALLVIWGADVHIMAERKELAAQLQQTYPPVDIILLDRLCFTEFKALINGSPCSPLTIVVANTWHQPEEMQQQTNTLVINQKISAMQFRSLIQRYVAARRQASG